MLRLGGGVALGLGVVGSTHSGGVAAHPGPYQPYGVADLPGATEVVVSADGTTAYAAVQDGYATLDVSVADDPTVLARRTDLLAAHESGPMVNVQDVKVDGDTLAVVGPANPRPGRVAGLLLVDVSDPSDPVERGFFETRYPIHNCDLADGYAYLTGNGAPSADDDTDGSDAGDGPSGNPLVVVDVSDPDEPVEAGRWSLFDEDPAWAEVASGLRSNHDVTVHGDVAVVAHWDAGTWLLDVSDPTDPTALGAVDAPEPADLASLTGREARRESVAPPGNSHYATLDEAGDLLAVGRESWGYGVDTDDDGERDEVRGGPSGVSLYDVSDRSSPRLRSTIDPPPTADPTFAGMWTTAHNLDVRAGTLYSSWYRGGVKRHDVSDPSDPVEETHWLDPDETEFWTAQAAVAGPETGYFVATSRGVDDVPGRLYVFPDHAGTMADPPSLTDPPSSPGPNGTAANGSGNGSFAKSTPASTPTPEADGTPTRTSTGPSSAEAPGFGLAVGFGALGAGVLGTAAWLSRGRDDR